MANQKVTQLPAANTSNDADLLYVVQGTTSRKTTKQLLMASTLAVANAAASTANAATATANAAANTANNALSQVGTAVQKTGDTMTGDLDMGSNQIENLGTPFGPADATTKTYVDTADALKLDKSGGTMTGALNMGNNPITILASPSASTDAATKGYVDTGVSSANSAAAAAQSTANTAVSNASTAQTAANAAQTTANNALPKAGGTMTGGINMGSQGLTNLATPSASTDASTKGYVDTALVGKQNTVATTTGVSVALVTPQEYGSFGTPETGNIAVSLTSAVRGIDQIVYHDDTVAPTIVVAGGTAVKFGPIDYSLTKVNVIVFWFMGGTNVGYIITPAV